MGIPDHLVCPLRNLYVKKQQLELDITTCFLTCIQISQEAGQVVWYSHLFKNLPQFVVIHTVKGFSVVNEGEVDVFP